MIERKHRGDGVAYRHDLGPIDADHRSCPAHERTDQWRVFQCLQWITREEPPKGGIDFFHFRDRIVVGKSSPEPRAPER